jgi:hypothetical protein
MCRVNSYKASYRHSIVADTGNHIVDKHNIRSKTSYMQAMEEKTH